MLRMSSTARHHFLRPKLHHTAPYGWLNDPCGPGYDPATKKYHLFYQCKYPVNTGRNGLIPTGWIGNPKSCEWGNICWGHATSRDLVNWEQDGSEPVLAPDTAYDGEGVFTGCFAPTGLRGEEGQLSVIYSSICHLPIHWTLPYKRASEGIAAATSSDGGKTWTKVDANPILREEPEGIHVTGWRDPYLCEWPALDHVLGRSSRYGLVSGGIQDDGPTVFLYSVPAEDLARWEYLGPLLHMPKNHRFSPKWSGDFGVNMECANFATLQSETGGPGFDFIIAGIEGAAERNWVARYQENKPETHPRRTIHHCNWLSGALERTGPESVRFIPTFGGVFDHGTLYAVNSFRDPVSGRQIAWGWIPEEDIPIGYCTDKGWNGCLSLPRELFLQRIPDVTAALSSRLNEITAVHMEPGAAQGSFTIYTLGIRPLLDVTTLRFAKPQMWRNISLPRSKDEETLETIATVKGQTWKLKAAIHVMDSCSEVGVHLRHNADLTTRTTVSLRPMDEKIVVDRSRTTTDPDVNTCEEEGPFTLFTLDSGNGPVREKFELEVFWDGNTLEVFACDRFALTTMVYTTEVVASGISLFAKGKPGSAVFGNVEVSDG